MAADPVELIYRIFSIDLVYRVLSAFAILTGTYLVGKAVQGVLRQALRGAGIPRAEVLVVSAFSKYVILFLGLLASLEHLAIPVAPFLAAFGVLALIIGLASRNMIESLLSGFLLTASRPFEVGDLIGVNDVVGEVVEFDLMKTILKAEDGVIYVVPNSDIINSGVINLTPPGTKFKIDLEVEVSYGSDLASTRLAILDIVNSCPLLSRDQPVSVDIKRLDRRGVCLVLVFFVPRFSLKKEAASEVLEGLLNANREGKIKLAYEGALSVA